MPPITLSGDLVARRGLLLLALPLAACRRPDGRPGAVEGPVGVTVARDVEYATMPVRAPAPHEKSLRLDVYEPAAGAGRRPAFVAIHGGGLRTRDKADENMAQLCRELAVRGVVCLSINYRMIPDEPASPGSWAPLEPLAAAVQDAASAVRWLRRHAERYRVDPARIAVGGSSAGATVALHLGYGPTAPELALHAVLSWAGSFYGSERLIDPGEPALFVVHGTADAAVEPAAAVAVARRAAEVGLRYELHLCQGLGHNMPLDRRPGGKSLYQYLTDFLEAGPAARPRAAASGGAQLPGGEPKPCPH